ncbi:MAG: hypothetical protein WC538_19980 [Thermoanaerobaculia bacterium]|jgi:hypothetical protein
MIVVRNVFHCHPGQAKQLVAKLKAANAVMLGAKTVSGARVLSDSCATFWTVVLEIEAASLEAFEQSFQKYGSDPAIQSAMEGYMAHVTGGHREIWKVE